MEALIARESRPGRTVDQVGAPYTKATYTDFITADQTTVVPLCRPIIYVSLALAAGFLALSASNFVPTVHSGLVAAGVMLMAMFGELMLTPILMYSTRLVTCGT